MTRRRERGAFRLAKGIALVGSSVAGFSYYRRWHTSWGAMDAEVALGMPGDELLQCAAFNVTRAITIQASPEDVWPWIAQIGFGRAGFYSYDLIDNHGHPSGTGILPEFQQVTVGEWIPMSAKVTDNTAFRIHSFEQPLWMLWTKPGSTWCWVLIPQEDGSTRLVVRLKADYRWTKPTIVTDVLLMEIADFPMMRKLLLNLRARAESTASTMSKKFEGKRHESSHMALGGAQ
jgi:hypothetical protein